MSLLFAWFLPRMPSVLARFLLPVLSGFFCLGALSSCGLSAGPRFPEHEEESRIITGGRDPNPLRIIRRQSPEKTTYAELVQLAGNPTPSAPELSEKLYRLFTTPFIRNKSAIPPQFQEHPVLGDSLRITTWNVEQSSNAGAIAQVLRDPSSFDKLFSGGKRPSNPSWHDARRQLEVLRSSDVVLLQEVDIGHPRSGYLDVPEHLAEAWNMNYAYGVQYLEVDPAYLGTGDRHIKNQDSLPKVRSVTSDRQDSYHGLFGCAVLSRFPIKRVQVVPLQGVNYDWFHEESKRDDVLEVARRSAVKVLFRQGSHRELKIGSRSFLRVDLHVPGVPLETVSVINVHLEIKLSVKKRREQLREILEYMKEIKNPVVLGGDFNSTQFNLGATSIPKEATRTATDPSRLASLTLFLAEISSFTHLRDVLNFAKNYCNPLAAHIPAVLENSQRATFLTLRDFRFSDGGAFDFRGEEQRSTGNTGVLSNSNERGEFGFAATYVVPRPLGPFGYEKLDWIFVKAFLQSPNDARGSYRLAPHFGETLTSFNRASALQFSDHDPITVVLPVDDLPVPQAPKGVQKIRAEALVSGK